MCVCGLDTFFAFAAWMSVEQTGEEIHSKTGYTRTEMRELRQSYLDEGYTEKDFQADMIIEIHNGELYERIGDTLYIISCCGLWYWTVSVKKIENSNGESNEDDTGE